MRLFAGVWPCAEVRRDLERLERPHLPAVRWTGPERWHVTLAFFGDVDGALADPLSDALTRAAGSLAEPPTAVLGPATELLGRSVLCVPVSGLDDLARRVRDEVVTAGLLDVEEREFRGHLTLARGRGGRPLPRALAGVAVAGTWPVSAVDLVRSTQGAGGARYETVARATIPPDPHRAPDATGGWSDRPPPRPPLRPTA